MDRGSAISLLVFLKLGCLGSGKEGGIEIV